MKISDLLATFTKNNPEFQIFENHLTNEIVLMKKATAPQQKNMDLGAFTYDVRCFWGIFDLPTLIRYFTT